MVAAVCHFRHCLCGLSFTILTDHAALQWLLTFKEPEEQVTRWIKQLLSFQFTIHQWAGTHHTNGGQLCPLPSD